MRISTGKYKSRKLVFAKTEALRPTSDKIRKAVFDIIGARIKGAKFLDLYAGTGAVGLEAVSRGALAVDFVDVAFESVRIIRKNLEILGIQPTGDPDEDKKSAGIAAGVYRYSADRFLRLARSRKFDFIFLDPPYHEEPIKCLRVVEKYDNLSADGWVVFEHTHPIVLTSFWRLIKNYQYGHKWISILEHGSKAGIQETA